MKGGFRQIQGFGDPDCAKVIQAGLWLSDVVCFRLPSKGPDPIICNFHIL